MAHKKGVGSTDNGRDSRSKRLGVKLFGGQVANAGNIIVRQRGTKYHAGENTYLGKDYTIHAKVDGTIFFNKRRGNKTFVSVIPATDVAEAIAPAKPAAKKAAPKPKVEAKETPAVAEAPKAEKKASEGAPGDALFAIIGTATVDQKDDLKKIKGVGPKLEENLNEVGVFTYEQVSKMNDKACDLLDELLSSGKGKAKKDNWTEQVKNL